MTPAPRLKESQTALGKTVVISGPDDPLAEYKNVIAYAKIPEIYNVSEKDKIRIKWTNNGNAEIRPEVLDTNNNGKIDYVQWTVNHLSEQTFEIIYISKAFWLDENKNMVADIYDLVRAKDNNWAEIPAGNYIRATFEKTLGSKNDITIYAKPAGVGDPLAVEVYPVYVNADGSKTQGGLVATFPKIDREAKYKILLTKLQKPTSVFDLRVESPESPAGVGDPLAVEFDWVVDPTPATVTDDFLDTTKIADSTGLTVNTSGGTVALAASSSWTCGDTLTDSRDSKTYTTVLIGAQCWMRQNINVGTKITSCTGGYVGICTTGGDTVQNQGTSCDTIQKYCYSDDENNCDSNGGLYQWNQAMCGSTDAGAQGICPTGWHIPTHDEYTTLELAVCTSGSCATDFPYDASTTGWRGTNEGTTLKTVSATKFSGLLAGNRDSNGSFSNVGTYGNFWTSLPAGANAWGRNLNSSVATVYRYTYGKASGFSVRCLKN